MDKGKRKSKEKEKTQDKAQEVSAVIQQHEDAALKTAIHFFADEILPYLGIEGKVTGFAPTEVIHLELKRFLQDFNLIMEDGTWKHFEFQSENEGRKGLRRYRCYEAVTSYQYGVQVTTYVLYSGKIQRPMTELQEGVNTYKIVPIIMRSRNADRVIEELQEKVERGERLNMSDLVPLALCLLMDGKTSQKDRVKSALRITQNAAGISTEDILKMEAVVFVMADKFLNEMEMEEIKEGIRMTTLGRMLVDMGKEEGKKEGKREGLSEGIDQANRLSRLLLDEKKYDELERALGDREYQKTLFVKYSIS